MKSGVQTDFSVLGVGIAALDISAVIGRLKEWIARGEKGHFVSATGMHGVMEAYHDPGFRDVLNHADLVVPDGTPLVWLGRLKGFGIRRRVYGPDLLLETCDRGRETSVRHFFYGGDVGVPEALSHELAHRYPGLIVAGTYSPPFRSLTQQEDEEVIQKINAAKPDVVWVGISTPKQERWMFEHRQQLDAPVMVGVGAAFDIHSGRKKQAPVWMREHGLEWLYRLLQEPRRLWRRYIVLGSEFVFWVTMDLLGLRRFE